MTISFGAIGAKVILGTTTVDIAYPASPAAGDLLVAGRCIYRDTATATDETGWTAAGDLGGGNLGSDATGNHKTRMRGDTKVAVGGESGTVQFDQGNTPNGVCGIMARYASDVSGNTWDIVSATGDDSNHNANRSAAASSNLDLAPGDMVIAIAAGDNSNDYATSAQSITASGITFGTTNRRATGVGATTGIDGNIEFFDALISSGSGVTALSLSFTTATLQCGPIVFIRLREAATPSGPVRSRVNYGALLQL